ncbi:TIGR03086 family metal-binding protein [Nocardia sp. CDC160]|uniref:TIGR03086 family metal-binding protein n=1 Tax=Nocardia sp. CDC160 TaxID=3112166 RepID=UPI002DB6B3B1|nr:TIGR03086 family metal-binding protein [Nocardia sp. CDC160]MEC3919541.1 TIGR03086 family metal-binding protein [Nocardia sp. CDC160]
MTTPAFDMEAAATAVETVVSGVTEADFERRTPSEITVRDMLAHVLSFTEGFRQGATKEAIGRSQPPGPAPLAPDWRERIPAQLKALVAAWREPEAWVGETEVGGVLAPAPQMAIFALDELVIHGWDLARATGQPYSPAQEDLAVLLGFLRDTPREGIPGLFGPVIDIPAEAPLLDRVVGLTGRDPAWAAT